MGRLDDARRRLATAEAQQAQIVTPQQLEQLLLAAVQPLIHRLIQAARRHVRVDVLRRRFQSERAAQLAERQRLERKLRSRDFTSCHRIVGDYEKGTIYSDIGVWLQGDGLGGAVLFSVTTFALYEGPSSHRTIRLRIELDTGDWEIQESVRHYAHVGPDTYTWDVGLSTTPLHVNAVRSILTQPSNDDQLARIREAIEGCVVQIVDHFRIPQSEVDV